MGSLKRKLEGEVEIKATAGEVHHEIFESRPHHTSHAAPHIIQRCDLIEGQLGQPGSVIQWRYTSGGKPIVVKCVIEEINKDKKLVKQRVVEGSYTDEYKYLIGTTQVIPKNTESCIVRWSFEYEKLHSGVPEPTALLDTALAVTKEIGEHHDALKK